MKITDYEISRYRLPAGKAEQLEFDDDQPGFGVHFRRSGANSFVLQYGSGKNRKRPAIGRVGEIKAASARRTAQEWMAAFRAGRDPQADKAKAKIRVERDVRSALTEVSHAPADRMEAAPTHKEATYSLNAHTKLFRPLPMSAIDKRSSPYVWRRLRSKVASAPATTPALTSRRFLDGRSTRAFAMKTQSNAPTRSRSLHASASSRIPKPGRSC